MKRPEMIVFDYGYTLCAEPSFNLLHGYGEVLKYVNRNPREITAQEITDFDNALFNIDFDIQGASSEGIFPVWYRSMFQMTIVTIHGICRQNAGICVSATGWN